MSRPDLGTLRSGRADCPSDFALDRLHAGELAEQEAAALGRHMAGCAECEGRLAERRAGFDAIEGVDPRAMLARIRTGLDAPAHPPLREWLLTWARRLLAPTAALAAAAIVLVVITGREGELAPTRFKGSPALHVFRLTGEHGVEASSGDTFAPGDRLRFAVDLPAAGYVVVLGVEASGALYTAWPVGEGLATPLAAGAHIELPGAVALDEKLGRETLYLVYCPPELGPPSCTSRGRGAAPECRAGCVPVPFVLEKRP